jgi:hypothetical protein
MAIKDNVDFSLFTNDFSFDLFSNSIRRAFSYDSYGDKKIFQAVVISQPMPLDPSEQVFFLDPKKERTVEVSKFSYRARILGAWRFLNFLIALEYWGLILLTSFYLIPATQHILQILQAQMKL